RVYTAGSSQSVSIVNGRMTSSLQYNYILTPRNKGSFRIGPVTVKQKGKEASTTRIAIEVVEGKTPPANSQRPGGAGSKASEVFIRTKVDKNEAYVGEQITLTFQLFSRIRFWADPEYDPPSTIGFWKEDLPPQNSYYTDIKGDRYRVTEIKTALFPTSAGPLGIGPAKLSYEPDAFRSGDPFDIFNRGRGARNRSGKQTMHSDSLTVQVLPLPKEGRPPSFTGTVGKFQFQASVDRNQVKANEPVTLKVKIWGDGNVATATIPDLVLSESFKVYDSGSNTSTTKPNYKLRGQKEYTRVIVPRFGGEYELPAISFSYFDPEKKEYVTHTSSTFPLVVEGPRNNPELAQNEVERMEEDLRFLKEPATIEWKRNGSRVSGWLLVTANAAPLLLLGGVFLARVRRERTGRDPVRARARRADASARRALAGAQKIRETAGDKEFAGTLSQALFHYLRDKMNLPVSGMTKRVLLSALESRSLPPETVTNLASWIDRCDRARFANEELSPDDRRRLLEEAEELIVTIGRSLHRRGSK
ncbi:MAG: protein BatD, partial [Gemmatimonadetes bacterium]|nr:protein BatD [Gemmatimonadota bacterium]